MSGIQTNFRAVDMLGGAKQEVAVEAPKKVAAPKAAPKKVEAKVEAPVAVEVVETEAVVEPAVEAVEE
jgi:hypothetical protein